MEARLRAVFVDRKEIRAQDDMIGFPLLWYTCRQRVLAAGDSEERRAKRGKRYLCLAGSLIHLPTLENLIEGEAAILVDWGESVEV